MLSSKIFLLLHFIVLFIIHATEGVLAATYIFHGTLTLFVVLTTTDFSIFALLSLPTTSAMPVRAENIDILEAKRIMHGTIIII